MSSVLRFDEWQDSDGNAVLDGTGLSIPTSALPVGSILQVFQTVKTDTFSTTSTSMTDITGLSVSITPSSATSKILVTMDVKVASPVNTAAMIQLVRDSTAIYIGDSAGSRPRITYMNGDDPPARTTFMGGGTFLDSPATTSATVYKIQMRKDGGSGDVRVNFASADADTGDHGRMASSITVMEVAG